jgi:hypothetical protein
MAACSYPTKWCHDLFPHALGSKHINKIVCVMYTLVILTIKTLCACLPACVPACLPASLPAAPGSLRFSSFFLPLLQYYDHLLYFHLQPTVQEAALVLEYVSSGNGKNTHTYVYLYKVTTQTAARRPTICMYCIYTVVVPRTVLEHASYQSPNQYIYTRIYCYTTYCIALYCLYGTHTL